MTYCRKVISILILCPVITLICLSNEQPDSIYMNFNRFSSLYSSGDFHGAEKCMDKVLDYADDLPDAYYIAALNNKGLIKKSTGFYQEAIDYYNRAEELIGERQEMPVELASVYNNKSRIYTFQRSFPTAIEYLEKSVSLYLGIREPDKTVLQNLSTAYLNLGIIYFETQNYRLALRVLEKSDSIKTLFHLPESELVFLNLAKVYNSTGIISEAEKYYKRSLEAMERKFGMNYYRISEVYFTYGDFLYSTGRTAEALEAHENALRICRINYGNKHPLTALSYKQIADFYSSQSDYIRSLEYYQEALIAVDSRFNEHNIMVNPSIDSSLFALRLLDILKNKSRAMELFASLQSQDSLKVKFLGAGLATAELSFRLIDRIRTSYLTEGNRLYLSRTERETYINGIRTAGVLFNITGEDSFLNTMYEIVQRAKAANLRNDIIAKEAFRKAGIPDSIQKHQTSLASAISAYSLLISGSGENQGRDTAVLQSWKNELFYLNRKMEKLFSGIAGKYPDYYNILGKANPVPVNIIQQNLDKEESVIDYFLTGQDIRGIRDLFIFIISENDFHFIKVELDTTFHNNVMIINNSCLTPEFENIGSFTEALRYMYDVLIRPAEKWLKDEKVIIIPDEEIFLLPFDAFIYGNKWSNSTGFDDVQFLVKKYSFSYSFSSTLIPGKKSSTKSKNEVLSFVPFYESDETGDKTLNRLKGALRETRSIYKWFRGRRFEGSHATIAEFMKNIAKPAVFHLAMHSFSDTIDSRYSYLQFWKSDSFPNEGKLFNYEISLCEMNSPMVVLSSCNSGSGRLYHGEGILSIARGFILAGAGSVVKTSWEVNDEVSAEIMKGYYRRLSRGYYKDVSLRLAKIDYLEKTSPTYAHPYYWASYNLVGKNSPLKGNHSGSDRLALFTILSGSIIILVLFYLRRRRINSASRL